MEYAFAKEKGKAVMKKIREVSKLVGVSKRTLQYYDAEGIVVVERGAYKHRLYNQDALQKIWEALLYKEMGFELKEIRQLQSMSERVWEEHLKKRIQENEEQIRALKEQIKFISSVLAEGMPQKPEEDEEITYVERIEELKERVLG